LSIPRISNVFVSTECEKITKVARTYGADIIPRPPELAQDETPEWLAWQHAVSWVNSKYGEFDQFLSLPCTAPLRIVEDVVKCLDDFEIGDPEMLITITEAHRSPWFNMVSQDSNKNLNLVLDASETIYCRQKAPAVFDMTTVAYVTSPDFIIKNNSIWDGRVKGVIIPKERSIDIDDAFDFNIAEFLMQKRIS
jgi:N-acylneuraminate cytidylyltransferase